MSTRRHRYRPLLGLLFAAVLVGMLEIILRLSGVNPAYRVENLGQWRFIANLDHQAFRGHKDGHSFLLSTNADGLRSTLKREKTPGVKRVALLGDSTVFGWGVDDEFTLTEEVSRQLPGIEVLNAAQPGYSTTMMAWFFGEVVRHYQPDYVVVFIPQHDINLVLVSDREVLSGGATFGADVRVQLSQHSRIYQVLRKQIFPTASRPFVMPDQKSLEPRVPRVSDDERTLAIHNMQAILETWGGRLSVGYVPYENDMMAPVYAPVRPRLYDPWIQQNGFVHIDLRPCCHGDNLILADDPGHFNAEGNRQIGDALAQKIMAMAGDFLKTP